MDWQEVHPYFDPRGKGRGSGGLEVKPGYIQAYENGRLAESARAAWKVLEECRLCPRQCRVDRLAGELGFCRTGFRALVSSVGPHFGEEAPLTGRFGSGTLFFAYCNLGCIFCQNYELSHGGEGREMEPEAMARSFLQLQALGCHNINLVTPTHVVPQILKALLLAIPEGLTLPLVYNCGGYEAPDTLRLLSGLVDIYMPDFKCWDEERARELCGAFDYPEAARMALKEMHHQVGDLVLDSEGVALRGLLIRHLVMPGGVAGTRPVLKFIARELSPDSYVNVMDQYRPCGQAPGHPLINRALNREEFWQARQWAKEVGLTRLDEDRSRIWRG
jgi:putative pyruvate formate lyase activating enzyme